MAESTFKGIKGSITIASAEGADTFEFQGAKPPTTLKELPKYAGECIARALLGADDTEVLELKAQIKDLRAKLDEAIAAGKQKNK
jgi:hypothetical protein